MRRWVAVFALLMMGGCATTDALSQRERQAELHYRLGVDALNKGMLPKAFDELMRADKLQPNRAEVVDALAYAWRLRGDLDKAEALYRKALRLRDRPETHNNYANLLLAMKRYQEAAAQAKLALDDPRYRNQHLALMNHGDAMLALGRYAEALKDYRLAEQFRPDAIEPILKEAHAYALMQRPYYARALLESLLRRAPTNRSVVAALVELLRAQGDVGMARAHLLRYRELAHDPLDRAWADDQLGQMKP
ncbi:MAG: hypothetical protein D6678_08000 [Zetaproteobacteria bacterium]|nr:MAG: hypothetical protein D6678_08000 [Zetaproteobacteria bacterium]